MFLPLSEMSSLSETAVGALCLNLDLVKESHCRQQKDRWNELLQENTCCILLQKVDSCQSKGVKKGSHGKHMAWSAPDPMVAAARSRGSASQHSHGSGVSWVS